MTRQAMISPRVGFGIASAFLCAVLGAGCSRSADAQSAAAPKGEGAPAAQAIAGSVQGRSLKVASAVFLWRDKADDMQLVLSDAPAVCEALSGGAYPRGATILSVLLKHNTRESRDAPFGVGEYPIRVGDQPQPQDAKRATFTVLDAACSPTLTARATGGTVRLTAGVAGKGAELRGDLDLQMPGGDTLRGGFTATFCTPSEEEPHGCR